MPDFRGISVALHSQYDCHRLPEFPPPPASPIQPRFTHLESNADTVVPTSTTNVAEVLVPIYPASRFWIEHTTLDPTPMSEATRFLYFKLIVAGRCVLSWGVSQAQDWTGRVMFGICRGELHFDSRRVLEREAFFFPRVEDGEEFDGGLEVRVFRSSGRRKEKVNGEDLPKVGLDGDPVW